MYLGVGGVRDVVEWFNRPDTRERVLCLIVADTVRGQALFASLFDDRGRLDSKLGDHIALFLFSHEASVETPTAREDGPCSHVIIPGVAKNFVPRSVSHWRWLPMGVSEMPHTIRDDVVQRTQSIAGAVLSHFDLDPEVAPCFIFLTRSNDAPFVIQTRDAADVQSIVALLGELQEVAVVLSASGLLSLPFRVAQTKVMISERDDLQLRSELDSAFLESALRAIAAALEPFGLGHLIGELDASTAFRIFQTLGLHRDPRKRKVVEANLVQAAEKAVLDEDIHRQLRQIRATGLRVNKGLAELAELEREIERRLERELNLGRRRAELQTTEDKLDNICGRFERKFRFRRAVVPLTELARAVVGTVPVIKDLADLDASISAIDRRQ